MKIKQLLSGGVHPRRVFTTAQTSAAPGKQQFHRDTRGPKDNPAARSSCSRRRPCDKNAAESDKTAGINPAAQGESSEHAVATSAFPLISAHPCSCVAWDGLAEQMKADGETTSRETQAC